MVILGGTGVSSLCRQAKDQMSHGISVALSSLDMSGLRHTGGTAAGKREAWIAADQWIMMALQWNTERYGPDSRLPYGDRPW